MNKFNTKPDPITITEAKYLKFFSEEKLNAHAVKHVLENKDEKWEKALDSELVRQLRSEFNNKTISNDQIKQISKAYETYIVENAKRNSQTQTLHIHAAQISINEEKTGVFYSREKIHGCTDDNVMYILSKNVRNDDNGLYNIVTAYKPYPNSKNGAKKLIFKDICNELAQSSFHEMANHWENNSI